MIRTMLAGLVAMAAPPAWSQSATPPAFGPDAPWAQAYARCANDAFERGVDAAREPTPWPVQMVPLSERECAGEVPAADSLGVRATVALVHAQLLHRFGPGRSLALAPRLPLRLPELFPMGDGVACPHPDYPGAALRAQAEGISTVEITFDPQGQPVESRVVSASGPTREHRLLDRAAVESLALCQVPAGKLSFVVSYHWRIAGDSKPASGAQH